MARLSVCILVFVLCVAAVSCSKSYPPPHPWPYACRAETPYRRSPCNTYGYKYKSCSRWNYHCGRGYVCCPYSCGWRCVPVYKKGRY